MTLENTYEIGPGAEVSANQDWFSFDGTSYSLDTSASGPLLLPTPYGVAAYDSVRNKIVYVNGGWYDEYGTWELDLSSNIWSDVTYVPGHPPWAGRDGVPGSWASMCFDTVNNESVLCIGNPWDTTGTNGEFSIYTWNGSIWTQQVLTGDIIRPCIWPQMFWDESRDLIWGFSRYYFYSNRLTLVWQLDPSTWNLTVVTAGGGGYYPGGPSGTLYANGATMVDWKDNKKALLVTRGVDGYRSGYGPPPPDSIMFSDETWVVEESAPSTFTWTQLTEVGSLSIRGYANCVADGDTVYVVGGMSDDPFNPSVKTDTYAGVVDPIAETITWTDKSVAPPSSLGWGTILVKV